MKYVALVAVKRRGTAHLFESRISFRVFFPASVYFVRVFFLVVFVGSGLFC